MRRSFPSVVLLAIALVGCGGGGGGSSAPSGSAPAPSGRLVYDSTWEADDPEIWIMNTDGTGATRLMTEPAQDQEPAWSPDATRIAFWSDRDGDADIYVMDADGGTVTQITDAPGDDLSPAWSPDGTLIAFSGGGEGNSEIYVVPTTGGEPVNLTNDPGDDFSPAWSPDGTLIAFSSYRGEGLDAEVFLMNADGSDQRAITSNDAMDGAPAWSPDGTRIAFESDRDAPPPESPSPGMIVFTAGISDIYVMNADGSDVVRVTQRADGGGAAHPSWSPDGTYLAYGLGQFGMHGIAIVRPDGADEQILIGPDDAGASSPDWGPA